jgi:hypothetical protein
VSEKNSSENIFRIEKSNEIYFESKNRMINFSKKRFEGYFREFFEELRIRKAILHVIIVFDNGGSEIKWTLFASI